jgi:DNA polymerase III epsilon subunit-like protein/uncharacterized glyoxalase superfamily protein PhnB
MLSNWQFHTVKFDNPVPLEQPATPPQVSAVPFSASSGLPQKPSGANISPYRDIQSALPKGWKLNVDPTAANRVNIVAPGGKHQLNIGLRPSDFQGLGGNVWIEPSASGGKRGFFPFRVNQEYQAEKGTWEYTGQTSSQNVALRLKTSLQRAQKKGTDWETEWYNINSQGDESAGLKPIPSLPQSAHGTSEAVRVRAVEFNQNSTAPGGFLEKDLMLKGQEHVLEQIDRATEGKDYQPVLRPLSVGGGPIKDTGFRPMDFKRMASAQMSFIKGRPGLQSTLTTPTIPDEPSPEWLVNRKGKGVVKAPNNAFALSQAKPYTLDESGRSVPMEAEAITDNTDFSKTGYVQSQIKGMGAFRVGNVLRANAPASGGSFEYVNKNEPKADFWGRDTKDEAKIEGVKIRDILEGRTKIELNPDIKGRALGGGVPIERIGTLTTGIGSEGEDNKGIPQAINARMGPNEAFFNQAEVFFPSHISKSTGEAVPVTQEFIEASQIRNAKKRAEALSKLDIESTEQYLPQLQEKLGSDFKASIQPGVNMGVRAYEAEATDTSNKGFAVKAGYTDLGSEEWVHIPGQKKPVPLHLLTPEIKGAENIQLMFGSFRPKEWMQVLGDYAGIKGKPAQEMLRWFREEYVHRNDQQVAERGFAPAQISMPMNVDIEEMAAKWQEFSGQRMTGVGLLANIYHNLKQNAKTPEDKLRFFQRYGQYEGLGGEKVSLGPWEKESLQEQRDSFAEAFRVNTPDATPEQIQAAWNQEFVEKGTRGGGRWTHLKRITEDTASFGRQLIPTRVEEAFRPTLGFDVLNAVKNYPEFAALTGADVENLIPQGSSARAAMNLWKYQSFEQQQREAYFGAPEPKPEDYTAISSETIRNISAFLQSSQEMDPLQQLEAITNKYFVDDQGNPIPEDSLPYNEESRQYLANPRAILGGSFEELGVKSASLAKAYLGQFTKLARALDPSLNLNRDEAFKAGLDATSGFFGYARDVIGGESGQFIKRVLEKRIRSATGGGTNLKPWLAPGQIGASETTYRRLARQLGFHPERIGGIVEQMKNAGAQILFGRYPLQTKEAVIPHTLQTAEEERVALGDKAYENVQNNPRHRGALYVPPTFSRAYRGDVDVDPGFGITSFLRNIFYDKKGRKRSKLSTFYDPVADENMMTREGSQALEASQIPNPELAKATNANVNANLDIINKKNVMEEAYSPALKGAKPRDIQDPGLDAFRATTGGGTGVAYNASFRVDPNEDEQTRLYESIGVSQYNIGFDALGKGWANAGLPWGTLMSSSYTSVNEKTGKAMLAMVGASEDPRKRSKKYAPGDQTKVLSEDASPKRYYDIEKLGQNPQTVMEATGFMAKMLTDTMHVKGVKNPISVASKEQFAAAFAREGEEDILLSKLGDKPSQWNDELQNYMEYTASRFGWNSRGVEALMGSRAWKSLLSVVGAKAENRTDLVQRDPVTGKLGVEQIPGEENAFHQLMSNFSENFQNEIQSWKTRRAIAVRGKRMNGRSWSAANIMNLVQQMPNGVNQMFGRLFGVRQKATMEEAQSAPPTRTISGGSEKYFEVEAQMRGIPVDVLKEQYRQARQAQQEADGQTFEGTPAERIAASGFKGPQSEMLRKAVLEGRQLVGIDTETTGLGNKDEVIEYYGKNFNTGQEVESRFMPYEAPITPGAQAAHQITPDDLVGKPLFEDLSDSIQDLHGKNLVVGANPSFDAQVLQQTEDVSGGKRNYKNGDYLDIQEVYRENMPGMDSYKLGDLYKQVLGKEPTGAHGAKFDVQMTEELTKHAIETFGLNKPRPAIQPKPVTQEAVPANEPQPQAPQYQQPDNRPRVRASSLANDVSKKTGRAGAIMSMLNDVLPENMRIGLDEANKGTEVHNEFERLVKEKGFRGRHASEWEVEDSTHIQQTGKKRELDLGNVVVPLTPDLFTKEAEGRELYDIKPQREGWEEAYGPQQGVYALATGTEPENAFLIGYDPKLRNEDPKKAARLAYEKAQRGKLAQPKVWTREQIKKRAEEIASFREDPEVLEKVQELKNQIWEAQQRGEPIPDLGSYGKAKAWVQSQIGDVGKNPQPIGEPAPVPVPKPGPKSRQPRNPVPPSGGNGGVPGGPVATPPNGNEPPMEYLNTYEPDGTTVRSRQKISELREAARLIGVGGRGGGGGGEEFALDENGQFFPRDVQEEAQADGMGYSDRVGIDIRSRRMQRIRSYNERPNLSNRLNEILNTIPGYEGNEKNVIDRVQRIMSTEPRELLKRMTPGEIRQGALIPQVQQDMGYLKRFASQASGVDRNEALQAVVGSQSAKRDVSQLGYTFKDLGSLDSGKLQRAEGLFESPAFQSLSEEVEKLGLSGSTFGEPEEKMVKTMLAQHPEYKDAMLRSAKLSTDKGIQTLYPEHSGVMQVAQNSKEAGLLGKGNYVQLAGDAVERLNAAYEKQKTIADQLSKTQGQRNEALEKEQKLANAELRSAKSDVVIQSTQKRMDEIMKGVQPGATMNTEELAEMDKLTSIQERAVKRGNAAKAELQDEDWGGAARRVLGGFGLMYMKSIYGIATENMGYGMQQRQEFDQTGAQAMYQATGVANIPYNQQNYLKTNQALYGVNNDPRLAGQIALSKNPVARDVAGGALAGVSAWGYTQFLAGQIGGETGAALGAAALPIGAAVAGGSMLLDASARLQDPQGLAYRGGTGKFGLNDYLALGMMPEKDVANYKSQEGFFRAFHTAAQAGAPVSNLMSFDYKPLQDKSTAQPKEFNPATGKWETPASNPLGYDEKSTPVAPITQTDRFFALQREVAGRFENYSTQAQAQTAGFLLRSGGTTTADNLKNIISDYEMGGWAQQTSQQGLAGLGFRPGQIAGQQGVQFQQYLADQEESGNLDESKKASLTSGFQRMAQLPGVERMQGIGALGGAFDPSKAEKFAQNLDKLSDSTYQLYQAQRQAYEIQKAAGMKTGPEPDLGNFLQVTGEDRGRPEYGEAKQMSQEEIESGMQAAQAKINAGQQRLGISQKYQNQMTALGHSDMIPGIQNFFKGMPEGKEWMADRLMSGDGQALSMLAMRQPDTFAKLSGPTTIQGAMISPNYLAGQADRSLDGQTLTGLGQFRSSLWMGNQTPQQTGAQIFGQNANSWAAQSMISGTKLRNPITNLATGQQITQVGGTMGAEFAMAYEDYDYSMAQIGQRQKSNAIDYAYQMKLWGLEDQQRNLGFNHQMKQFGFQEQGMQLQRESAQMQNNFWWQNAGMQQQQQQTQRSWTRQDWGINAGIRAMQWGWQQDDFQEEKRFMTGRQRRLAERQQERAGIMHNVEDEQINRQQKRQQELWKMEDDRFELSKAQHTAEYAMQQKNFDLQKKEFEEQKKFYLENKKIEDEIIALQRKHWLDQHKLSEEAIKMDEEHAKKIQDMKMRQLELNASMEVANGTLKTMAEDSMVAFIQSIISLTGEIQNFVNHTNIPQSAYTAAASSNGGYGMNIPVYQPPSGAAPASGGSSTTGTFHGHAGGGQLSGSDIVGEKGWEYVINGQVIPHEQSVAMAQSGITPTPDYSSFSSTVLPSSPSFSKRESKPMTIVVNVGNEELKRFVVDAVGEQF